MCQKLPRSFKRLNKFNWAECWKFPLWSQPLAPELYAGLLWGGAPPRPWADFLWIFLIGAIYSLPRCIASSPQGVHRSKTRDAPEGKHETVDPSCPWDSGRCAKSAWGSTPSSTAYVEIETQCNILEIIVIGEWALERGSWEVVVIYQLDAGKVHMVHIVVRRCLCAYFGQAEH